MRKSLVTLILVPALGLLASAGCAEQEPDEITCDDAGPQAPRDIDRTEGENPVSFREAPPFAEMNFCNVHFHRFAEHRSEGYPTLVREGGRPAGYRCRVSGSAEETHSEPLPPESGAETKKPESGEGGGCDRSSPCSGFRLGDTVEVHWVYTTCRNAEPGEGLGGCARTCLNPQLRVEARVFYLEDGRGGEIGPNPPPAPGAKEYLGSTTGPRFNDVTCSAFQVTWNVGRECSRLGVERFGAWCQEYACGDSDRTAHGARPLVTLENLLAPMD